MRIIYSFWKASVTDGGSFHVATELRLCYFYMWCWDRLVFFNRITGVWSEWTVCGVCSYWWLTDSPFFSVFYKRFSICYKSSLIISRSPMLLGDDSSHRDPLFFMAAATSRFCRLCFLLFYPTILTAFTLHLKVLQLFFLPSQAAHTWYRMCCITLHIVVLIVFSQFTQCRKWRSPTGIFFFLSNF